MPTIAQYSARVATDASIRFFDSQFQRQVREADLRLNPFEQRALPWLQGRVLDHGCGLGNLAVAAARAGHPVLALDASPTAIAHLQQVAREAALPIEAVQADLRSYPLAGEFDTVVSIGLLMFLDCATAERKLDELLAHLRPGGIAVVNVLAEGTTFMDMFDPAGHCLFTEDRLRRRFESWELLSVDREAFPAPGGTAKVFVTVVARKPPPG